MPLKIKLLPVLAICLLLAVGLYHMLPAYDAQPQPTAREIATQAVRIGYLKPDPAIADPIEVRHFYVLYMAEIAKYLGWTYEFVEVECNGCLEKLDKGEIDLLLPVEENPNLATSFAHTQNNFFVDTLALYTRADEARFNPKDLTNLNGASIGIYRGRPANEHFFKFCQKNKIQATIHEYPNRAAFTAALESGEVDMVVDSVSNRIPEAKFLLAFDVIPTNIVSKPEKSYLLSDLDRASLQLQEDNPDLSRRYKNLLNEYTRHLVTNYTPAESEFIRSSRPVRAAIFGDYPPYVVYDARQDKIQGIFPELFKLLANTSGLTFDFKHYESQAQALEALKNGNADLLIDVFTAHMRDFNQHSFTKPIYYLDCTFIGPKYTNLPHFSTPGIKLAMVKTDTTSWVSYMQNMLPAWEIYQYDTINDCLEAVRDGKADYTLLDTLNLNNGRMLLLYPTLNLLPASSIRLPVCLTISKKAPAMLQTVLNKSITRIPTGAIDQLVRGQGMAIKPKLTPGYFFSQYPLHTGLSLGAILLLLVTLCFALQHNRSEKRQRLALTRKNAELEETLHELQETEKSRDAYKEQAETDALTGVLNKAAMEKFVKKSLAELNGKENIADAFIIADLDHFKEANDTHGHQYGDDILKDFAHALIRLTRHKDGVGRFGGDEFVLYLRNIPQEALISFAQRLQTAAHELDPTQKPPLSASIGIAIIDSPDLTYEEVFYRADKALYHVKEGGRDGYRIYGQ